MHLFLRNHRYKAQSLSEYVVILALVAVALIATVSFCGDSISGFIASMTNRMDTTASNSQLLAVKKTDPNTLVGSPSVINSIAISNITNSTLPGDGSTLTTSVTTAIETSGANGTTQLLLGTLEQRTQQLLSKGEITQQDANSLMTLANLGHQMAGVEALIENIVATSTSASDFSKKKAIYNGSALSAHDLAVELQFYESTDKQGNPIQIPTAKGTLIDQFQQIELNSLKNLSPSALQQVGGLVNQIAALANATEDSTNQILNGLVKVNPQAFREQVAWNIADSSNGLLPLPEDFTSTAASTHQNAATICNTQQGMDTGAQCQ